MVYSKTGLNTNVIFKCYKLALKYNTILCLEYSTLKYFLFY